MDHRRPTIQVVINNGVGQPQGHDPGAQNGFSNGIGQRHRRPLQVDEALQYSPMTSAPVFGLDSITQPDVGGQASANFPAYSRSTARKIIKDLDNETRSGSNSSARLAAVRKELLNEHLNADKLSEFKFKLPPGLSQPGTSSQNQTRSGMTKKLSPFANMMLDAANIAFAYPPLSAAQLPGGSFLHNVQASQRASAMPPGSTPTMKGQKQFLRPAVVVPPLDPSKSYHLGEDQGTAKRRKLNAEYETSATALRLKAQKEEADVALLKLQDLLHEVFETEDRLEPDTSSVAVTQESNAMFRVAKVLEVRRPILGPESHSRLQKSLQRVVGFGRLHDIPSEYITRVQKMCEEPIISAQGLDLKLEDASNDSEAQTWLQKLEDIYNTMLAIGTLLQTMSGRRSEKDLCPEDLVQAVPIVLTNVFDHCIIPAVESRPSGTESKLFELVSREKRMIGGLLYQARKLLASLANFLSRIDVSEGTITSTEFLATKLIFVENAHNDKESAVGYQKFESVRRAAMDVLAKIFSRYPDQRPFILDEILVSLEKLPSTRQNARQFKLIDGKNIQLLTALVIQLVQTTAMDVRQSKRLKSKRQRRVPHANDDDDSTNEEDDESESDDDDDRYAPKASLERLASRANKLYDNSVRSAQYIVKFIVQRAMTSTKSGDQPYRNILDLFTEDLISVLGSTDWPAAELLLRILASHMVGIAELDKSPATAKNMALELLGWMGSGISDLTASAQHLMPSMEDGGNSITEYLRQLYDEYSRHALHVQDLVAVDGPYRIALEYLQDRDLDNWQLASARGYYVVQWAKTVVSAYYDSGDRDTAGQDRRVSNLLSLLPRLLSDSKWLETNSHYNNVSTAHGKFAYILTVLNMGFSKAFDTILKVLLNSITSDQAKVRSRSLKSVITMLEKDPSLLDRDSSVMRVILRCATDASPMVRDSALSLIAKCIVLKPGLEEEGCRAILACASDATAGVRKRCITLSKDIFLKTMRQELKLAILDNLLQRTSDFEEGVASQARQTIEELLFAPFFSTIDSLQDAPKAKMALADQVSLIVNLVQRSENAADKLGSFLRKMISETTKTPSSNFKVCKAMVANMFERVVDDSASSEKDGHQALLQTITVFAKANSKLFVTEQLQALHPYIGNLITADDLFVFRSVVVIYRCVLPYISSAHNSFLKEVQNDLFKSVAKLARSELNEVMACLWTINGVLQNPDRLVKLTISVLKGIGQAKGVDLMESSKKDLLNRARSYVRIAGCVGRHCDLEKFEPHFKKSFPTWKGGSVAGLLVDFLLPFIPQNQPLELRTMALESLGSICQSWPAQFSREEPRRAISSVFQEDNASLHNIILRAFSDFFAIHEGKSEKLVQPQTDSSDPEATTRLGGSLKASDNDGAAALIAQHFLKDMIRIAQSRQDSYSLTAIELIASINRQGLVHPKECAGVLVSLETSNIPAIAKVAFETHKMLHQQYESMFEREYMRAVQDAFIYQRDVVGDSNGALVRPYIAKLAPLFEIVKISNSKYQKKFLFNLCSKVNFEPKKLDTTGNPPDHLLLARFLCQNLAFFEFAQIAELLPTIACMEKIVSATGTIVAHAIESEIFPPQLEPIKPEGDPDQFMLNNQPDNNPSHVVSPRVLRHLTTAAAILSMLWEARSHLRRQYGINSPVREKEPKGNTKELNKAPVKAHGVNGDRFWEAISKNMTCLDSEENMLVKCRTFATLLSIDDELKVAGDDDADADSLDDGLDDDIPAVNGNKPMKRKSSHSGGIPPKRPKSKNRNNAGKKRNSSEPEDVVLFD
ncbi:putative sister chromatid cohesion protein Mis4 [Talaromyces proteolyticus]|uniref:Sister chromatid cohesion protein n=1 Tax=Talaromyces proteolyticus TaxID=1131652 RepID=A0AAD4KSI8_9EURO|nr:putative sister chromatid cohesion protein Mis4 [Talaromyces proteolyticus]KAH8696105.1 putative sister chromatid cohesion protein Mis4 [Talaromyces proteolyticus]